MSSPSAAGVVRRRSVKSWLGVSLQSGAMSTSRQLDVRVKMMRLRSSVATSFAPGNSSDATSIESCRPTTGRAAPAPADWPATTANGVTNSDAARKARRRREWNRTDGGSNRLPSLTVRKMGRALKRRSYRDLGNGGELVIR